MRRSSVDGVSAVVLCLQASPRGLLASSDVGQSPNSAIDRVASGPMADLGHDVLQSGQLHRVLAA